MRLFSKPFGNRFALPQPPAKAACVFALSSGGCSLAPWVGRTLPVSSLSLCVCLFRFLPFPRHTFDSETRAAVPAAAAATPPAAAAAAADADYFSGISKFLF